MPLKQLDYIPEDFCLHALGGGAKIILCRKRSCLKCVNCDNVLWDFTNGPYMIHCGIHKHDVEKGLAGTCNDFREAHK